MEKPPKLFFFSEKNDNFENVYNPETVAAG
jgi:hypothetical protein